MCRVLLALVAFTLCGASLVQGQGGESPTKTPTGGVFIKENFLERLEAIKRDTPATCSPHGGIDCEKGEDSVDNSVICYDNYRESKERFADFCTQTRLQLISEIFLDKDGNEIPKEKRKPRTFGGITPSRIIVKLRNLSGIRARAVKVQGEIVKRKFLATGPMDIEPFSLEEYKIEFEERLLPIFPDFRTKYRTIIGCDNCLSSRRN